VALMMYDQAALEGHDVYLQASTGAEYSFLFFGDEAV